MSVYKVHTDIIRGTLWADMFLSLDDVMVHCEQAIVGMHVCAYKNRNFGEGIMNEILTQKEGKKPVYFMMNAPSWYIDLPDDDKIDVAEQISAKAGTGRTLTEAEVADLLSVSRA
jgi:hypothetical protein